MDETEQKAERDRAIEIIDVQVNKLAEHFDSVQVFCSRQTDGGEYTFGMERGSGNVYARQGQVREWLLAKEEEARIEARDRSQ